MKELVIIGMFLGFSMPEINKGVNRTVEIQKNIYQENVFVHAITEWKKNEKNSSYNDIISRFNKEVTIDHHNFCHRHKCVFNRQ